MSTFMYKEDEARRAERTFNKRSGFGSYKKYIAQLSIDKARAKDTDIFNELPTL